MQKLKNLLSDTLIYGISSVLARFINYLLVPFHTDVFNPAQYGIVGLVYAGIAFLNVLFTFGMESAYLRYAKEREKARDVFKTLQLGLFGIATVLALLVWLLGPVVKPLMHLDPSTQQIYLMMVGILWFDTMSIVPFAELRLIRKSLLFAGLRTLNVLINLGLNFYLILSLGWGIEAVFMANLAASAVTALLLWAVTAKLWSGSWNRAYLDRALRFGMPFIPAGIGYAINEMLDRFFLAQMESQTITHLYGSEYTAEDIVGIYNACYKLAVFMLLLIQMFRMAWQPFFLKHSEDSDAKGLYRDVFRYFNVVAGLLFLGVSLFVSQIVQIQIPILDTYLIAEEYWMGLHIVPVLLGAYWFHGWYMNFSAGIFIEEETQVLPQITLAGAAVTILANLALIPLLGMMGSAIATLTSYATMALMLYQRSRKVYPVSYQMGRATATLGIALAAVLGQSYLVFWLESQWMANGLLFAVGGTAMVLLGMPSKMLSRAG